MSNLDQALMLYFCALFLFFDFLLFELLSWMITSLSLLSKAVEALYSGICPTFAFKVG